MLALLGARPMTLGTAFDVARGCVREHMVRPVGALSPQTLRILGGLIRIPAAGALTVMIAWLGWFLANDVYARGWTSPPEGVSHWALGLRALLIARAFIAFLAVLGGEERLALRRFEFSGWLAVGLVSVMLECLNRISVAFLPWNAFRDSGFEWTDFFLPLFTPIMFLVMATKEAAKDFAQIRAHRPGGSSVPTSILGLNR